MTTTTDLTIPSFRGPRAGRGPGRPSAADRGVAAARAARGVPHPALKETPETRSHRCAAPLADRGPVQLDCWRVPTQIARIWALCSVTPADWKLGQIGGSACARTRSSGHDPLQLWPRVPSLGRLDGSRGRS
jgi:hypothetical protein